MPSLSKSAARACFSGCAGSIAYTRTLVSTKQFVLPFAIEVLATGQIGGNAREIRCRQKSFEPLEVRCTPGPYLTSRQIGTKFRQTELLFPLCHTGTAGQV